MKVSKLAYLGANATDLAAWKKFATQVSGLDIGSGSSDRVLYLRADERHHRLGIHAGAQDDVAHVGWEVAGHDALEEVAKVLETRGVRVEPGTTDDLAARRVVELAWFTCPYTGVRMELVVGDETAGEARFERSRPPFGFVMGELGMGHFGLYASDVRAAAEFYVRTLGFGISDWLVSPDGAYVAAFLHCNARHHSMALVHDPNPRRRIQHVFLETRSLDAVGITYDRCLERNVDAMSLSLRANDRSISFYFRNPSRWFFEYGWQLRVIDPNDFKTGRYVLGRGSAGGGELADASPRHTEV